MRNTRVPSTLFHSSSTMRLHQSSIMKRIVVLATMIQILGAAVGIASSVPVSGKASEDLPSFRDNQSSRKLSFAERDNLFNHETSGMEEDQGSDIGTNLMGDGILSGTETSTLKDSYSGNITTNTQDNSPPSSDNHGRTPSTYFHDSQSATIMASENLNDPANEANQQQSPGFFDGFENTKPNNSPAGYFDGFEITKQTQAPGFFDGFEIKDPSPNSDKSIHDISSKHPKRAKDKANSNVNSDESDGIPNRDIYIFVGFAVASLLLCILYWRDSIIVHERTQKKQARIDRLKNLYEGLDKYSTHILDDRIRSETNQTQPYSPKRLVAIHMGDNANHTIEKIDFIDDIEFGECSSHSDGSFQDDVPALTMRMVKRNSGTQEHWVKYSSYSSDEFTIGSDSDSDKENKNNNKNSDSDDDSIPAL